MNAPVDPSQLAQVSLDDKYTLGKGRVFLTGTQALVRLMLLQRERDVLAGPEHRGLHLGLPRLAARRRRPDHVGREEAPRAPPRRVPARRQRGPRRDRGVGHAAGRHVPGREVRRRVRHVVRQGPGRRSLRRRVQARQRRRHLPARRRARARRRRPRGQVLDPAAPVRAHLQGLHDPGAQPGQRAGVPRPRAARLRHEPLRRLLGRVQVRHRRGRVGRLGRSRSRAGEDPAADRLRAAAGRAQHPLARRASSSRRRACSTGRPTPRAAYVRANRLDRIVWDSPARAPGHRHHRQVLRRHHAGAGRPRHRRAASRATSACACTRWR